MSVRLYSKLILQASPAVVTLGELRQFLEQASTMPEKTPVGVTYFKGDQRDPDSMTLTIDMSGGTAR